MAKKRKHIDLDSGDQLYNKRARPSEAGSIAKDNPTGSQARIDPTYGQRGAFPGLDESTVNDDLFYGPADDGLQYLRMVRSEAKTVPNLLVAPPESTKQQIEDDLYQDYPQGYYADGAYTAAPLPFDNTRSGVGGAEGEEDADPQEVYYNALCSRFATLSFILQEPPPPTDYAPPPPSRPKVWRNKILKTIPKPMTLAQIPQDLIIIGLEVLEDVLTASNLRSAHGKNIGAWAWGLLARCRDLGTMGSEEVGVLRNLGKKAVWLLRRIAAGEVVEDVGTADQIQEADEDEPHEETQAVEGGQEDYPNITIDAEKSAANNPDDQIDDEEYNEGWIGEPSRPVDSGLTIALDAFTNAYNQPPSVTKDASFSAAMAEAQKRILLNLDSFTKVETSPQTTINSAPGAIETPKPPIEPIENTESSMNQQSTGKNVNLDQEGVHATLDMIVTVVGEFYGQRDLLDGRLLWDEMA